MFHPPDADFCFSCACVPSVSDSMLPARSSPASYANSRLLHAAVACVILLAWFASYRFSSAPSSPLAFIVESEQRFSSVSQPQGEPLASVAATPLEVAQSVCDPVRHVCHRELTWSELRLILEADTPQYLSRLASVQQRYSAAQSAMRAACRSVSDHVREHKFGAPCVLAEDGKRVCEFEDASDGGLAFPKSVVVPNDFAYALESPIEHSLIWTRQPLGSADSPAVLRLVESHFPAAQFETLHLVNPPALQTIKDIYHIHVFHKRRIETSRPSEAEESGVD